jgi:superfamily II DNA helicase RecQ
MKLDVITLRFDAGAGGFPCDVVQAFAEGKEVLSVGEHFFVHEMTPYLVLTVTYREADGGVRPRPPGQAGRYGKPDPRAELDPAEARLYDALRKWRAEVAKTDNVSHYMVLTNRQMAEIARRRPGTLAEMGDLTGVGSAKVARYGEAMLKVLSAAGAPAATPAQALSGDGGAGQGAEPAKP